MRPGGKVQWTVFHLGKFFGCAVSLPPIAAFPKPGKEDQPTDTQKGRWLGQPGLTTPPFLPCRAHVEPHGGSGFWGGKKRQVGSQLAS